MNVIRTLLISLLCSPTLASAVTDSGLQSKFQLEIFDDRVADQTHGKNNSTVLANLKPYFYQEKQNWRAYVFFDLFLSTDAVNNNESNASPKQSDGYLGLRELWVDYNGLTSYPGEYLRAGLQRIRANDGLWWDADIEALRWKFDTTLFVAEIAAAERFSLYRTNDNSLPYSEEDRQHLLGSARYQYQAGHWIDVRGHYLNDEKPLRIGTAASIGVDAHISNAQWLGIGFDSDYMNYKSTSPLGYSMNAIFMNAEHKVFDNALIRQNTRGRFIEAQLRFSTDDWHLGIAYANADACNPQHKCFFQTGLESNRSNFTGTRARIARFGEIYRASLENIRVNSIYATWTPSQDIDVNVMAHHFQRNDSSARVVNFLNNDPAPGSKTLGDELDMVISWYFDPNITPKDWSFDDTAALRLRSGIYKPENSVGKDGNNTAFLISTEFSWRF